MKNKVCRPARRASVVLTLLAALSLSGCSTLLAQVEPPQLALSDVQMLSSTLLEQRYRLTLRVTNPNAITLPISGVQYAVKFAGVDFASGVTPNAFRVPARGEQLIDIDVSTNLLRSAQQLLGVLQRGVDSVDYELTGSVDVDLPLVGAIPFSKTGSVPLTTSP